ncbi:MAG: 1,4-beta-xylanase [Balneola sp.]|jgi:endo-1,4-beta-xylanase|nr:1,4-beta-xylanase [Balneola sp.]MBE79949.1 1,4-beta-xylanase [Balneola sp.]|tara:strand:- start:20537 stop:21745 length:1209 start_codon:yes stop_codon:yes gene_type:complete
MSLRSKTRSVFILVIVIFGLSLQACTQQEEQTQSLYKAYEDAFLIGTALNRAQIFANAPELTRDTVRADRRGYFYSREIIPDPEGLELGLKHFNVITPENVMKWEEIHPSPGVYNFEAADRLVDIAQQESKTIVAHTLVWHSQVPDWVFEDEDGDELTREALLNRMKDHIQTIVGRYKGKVYGWDVVNEAFNEDGSFRESRWFEIIGEDFISKAFEYAHEADPDAQLYYNDYNMENPEKRAGIIKHLQKMLDEGVPVTGVGSQSHYSLRNFPEFSEIEQSIIDLSSLGVDVMITELDLNVLPSAWSEDGPTKEGTDIYQDGLPEEVEEEFTKVHKDLFELYLKHSDVLTRVTFWGVSDNGTWLNYLPTERVNYSLLFDRDNQPKPAFHALIDVANNHFKVQE